MLDTLNKIVYKLKISLFLHYKENELIENC
jgi:hypothetical protein